MSAWRIPLFDTRFGPDEEAAVLRPLRAGWLTMGEEVVKLEQELRELTGARHAIAVSNCTAALQLASAALGLGPGDEVIVPSLTFVATANAPRSLGAEVRLADVTSSHDLCVDPDSIEALITPRTRAIFVVHYAGFPCRMEEILALSYREVKKTDYWDLLAAGLVLTGGGSVLRGTLGLAEHLFNLPAKLGVPQTTVGMEEEIQTPEAATVVGLLTYAQRHARGGSVGFGGRHIFERVTGTMRRWVSELF